MVTLALDCVSRNKDICRVATSSLTAFVGPVKNIEIEVEEVKERGRGRGVERERAVEDRERVRGREREMEREGDSERDGLRRCIYSFFFLFIIG